MFTVTHNNVHVIVNPLPDSVHSKSHTRLSALILSVQLNLYSKQWHSTLLRLFQWFMAQTRSLWRFNLQNTWKWRFAGFKKEQNVKIFYTNLMLQHYFHMSYAYYKFDSQMYCIQHTLLNIFSYCLLHFTNRYFITT